MSWNPTAFRADEPSEIADEMIRTLNKQDPIVRGGAKLGMADQDDAAARGVILANGDLDEFPPLPTGRWAVEEFRTEDDYKRDLYLPAAHFLNSLPYDVAYWAKATFTNREDGEATLEIWYPTR